MTELALTRIFSVVMYYHFAFLAISIALFGLSASGVFAYVARRWLDRYTTSGLLAAQAVIYAAATVVALFALVRLRVGLNYTPQNLRLMLTIYALAALPFFTGGLVITLAISRFASRINSVYAADLTGAAAGCLVLIPLLDRLGAPGVVLSAAAGALVAAVLFAPAASRRRFAAAGVLIMVALIAGQATGVAVFDVTDTKGHTQGPRPVQQVEFVLANRGLRTDARRLVAELHLQGRPPRHAVHGHRLGRVDAHPEAGSGARHACSTCATS